MPEARSIPGLDKSQLGLFPVRVETLAGLVFVNLDLARARRSPSRSRASPERLAPYGIERLEPHHRRTTARQPANWKIVADNYLEGYHVPIAHPGLMRLLDYKHYDVELHDNWVCFDAPLRDKPSGNLMERAYQRLVTPMPGLSRGRPARLALRVHLPNTAIDLYPDQVWIWKIDADGALTHARHRHAATATPRVGCARGSAQFVNRKVNKLVGDEDVDLVANVQAGCRPRLGARAAVGREAAVGWFADKVRADLGERDDASAPGAGRRAHRQRARASASSRRRSSASRATGSTTCASRASRWTRASPPRSCTTTSRPARPCSSRRSSTRSSWPATSASARARARRRTTRTGSPR